MIIPLLHALACLALMTASIDRLRRPSDPGHSYHFLLPFSLTAGVLGIIMIWPQAMRYFVRYYSGGIAERDAVVFMLRHSPYRWYIYAAFTFPGLPFVGAVPCLGGRPWPMAITGLLTLLAVLLLNMIMGIR